MPGFEGHLARESKDKPNETGRYAMQNIIVRVLNRSHEGKESAMPFSFREWAATSRVGSLAVDFFDVLRLACLLSPT